MVFEYSYAWILPAFLIALAVAYYKFRTLSLLPDIPRSIMWLASSLRFLVLFILFILLLNPAVQQLIRLKEKPVVVIAQDNSVSLAKNKDSLYYQNEYRESLERMCSQLEKKYEVVRLTFGKTVQKNGKIDYSDNRTDISQAFDYVSKHFITASPDAVVLLTDGIYNAGVNPLYQSLPYPVYTVLLGDTLSYPDIAVRSLTADKFNFLHTIFPIQAEISASGLKGKKIKCILQENGNKIEERVIEIEEDSFLSEQTFRIEAKQKGIGHYSVAVEPLAGEYTSENNRAETWINIIDNTGEIAIFAHAPHPDLSAIYQAINASGQYHCSIHIFNEKIDSIKGNLILFHNPDPRDPQYRQILHEAEKRGISLWYILTNRESITDLSRFNTHYTADFSTGLNEYATLAIQKNFPFFELTEEETKAYTAYPPLVVPFGEIRTGGGRMLFTQKVKNTPTDNGILGFYETNGNRICYFWGEGLWRWRLYSYGESGSHALFDGLIHKITGYLANRQRGERLIHDFKTLYEDHEEAVVNVELYNKSYELVNTPEIQLDLKYQDKEFRYTLGRNENKYRINLGHLHAGEYTWQLSANLKGETFQQQGIFYVRSHNPELNNMVANTMLLKELAEHSGGQMYAGKNPEEIAPLLSQNINVKPVYKSEWKFIEWREMGIIGLLLVLLLCAEWFLLKFYVG